MAKKSRASVNPYQRGLVYYESFFPNRNDMLQTALDNVLSQQQKAEEKAALALEVYKSYSKDLDKDIDRLQKLRDSLYVKSIEKPAATAQFNVGQTNSSRRTVYNVQNTNARFNAHQAMLAAYYAVKPITAGSKGGPVDPVTQNEARQAYTANPSDPRAGLSAMKVQQAGTTEVPKSIDERNIGLAYTFSNYIYDEAQKPEYNEWGPDRFAVAASKLLDTLDPADRDSVVDGMAKLEAASKGAGAGAQVGGAGDVSTGGLATALAKAPDYGPLLEQVDKDIAAAKAEKATKKAELEAVQEAAKPEDLITAQRREYFEKFYPNETPAFMVNEQLSNLLAMKPEDAQKIIAAYRAKNEADKLAGRMPAETALGGEVVSSLPRYAAGKEGPRMPGDVIYGKGSPFVPSPEDMTAGVRQAEDYDAIARTVSPDMRSQIGRALNQDQLFAIESSDKAKADLKAKGLSIVGGRLVPTALVNKRLEVGGQVEVPSVLPESYTIAKGITPKDEAAALGDVFAAKTEEEYYDAKSKLEQLQKEIGLYGMDKTKLSEDSRTEDSSKRQDIKSLEALPKPSMTPEQKDAQIKVRAAMKAKQMYEAGEVDKATKTDIGMAVSNLYKANKAKGDQSIKDILTYVAKEYPRSSDQEEAATVLFALNYKDSRDALLKDNEPAAAPAEPVAPAVAPQKPSKPKKPAAK